MNNAKIKSNEFNNKMSKVKNVKRKPKNKDTDPDWSRECENCGQSPIVPVTGMCGPCTFGDADTIHGNW